MAEKADEAGGHPSGIPSSVEDLPGKVAIVRPKQLEEKVAEALRPFVKPDQEDLARANIGIAIQEVAAHTAFRGPLPHPEHFGQYEAVVKGAADRILAMAEKEQTHRHEWENQHLRWDGISNVLGLIFGWVLSLCLVAGAVFCATIGQPWVAGVLTGFAAFGAVGNLIRGRRLFGKADRDANSPKTEPDVPATPLPHPKRTKKKRR